MSLFQNIPLAPSDPILGLTQAFKKDENPQKVNLGVGAYKTDDLQPFVFSSVRAAEQEMLDERLDKEYLPIDGDQEFRKAALSFVLGPHQDLSKIAFVQSLGGTGALSLAMKFLLSWGLNKIYLSKPTWANHKPLCEKNGMQVLEYSYCSHDGLEFSEMCQSLEAAEEKSVVLFHASCHNPSGIDPSSEEWKELALLVKRKNLLPFFDIAYHGFGEGLDKDCLGFQSFIDLGIETLFAYSFSKNFGLYGERLGFLALVSGEEKVAEHVQSQLKAMIRSQYSSPPLHGAQIVKRVLQSPKLLASWKKELEAMRLRVVEMRKAFAKELPIFSFVEQQKGMFSLLGIEKETVQKLKDEKALYMPGSGRINFAGLCSKNFQRVVESLKAVL